MLEDLKESNYPCHLGLLIIKEILQNWTLIYPTCYFSPLKETWISFQFFSLSYLSTHLNGNVVNLSWNSSLSGWLLNVASKQVCLFLLKPTQSFVFSMMKNFRMLIFTPIAQTVRRLSVAFLLNSKTLTLIYLFWFWPLLTVWNRNILLVLVA